MKIPTIDDTVYVSFLITQSVFQIRSVTLLELNFPTKEVYIFVQLQQHCHFMVFII